MTRRRKEIGIRRKGDGWQAYIDVDGEFRSQQFAIDTPVVEMRAWRDTQTISTVIAPESGVVCGRHRAVSAQTRDRGPQIHRPGNAQRTSISGPTNSGATAVAPVHHADRSRDRDPDAGSPPAWRRRRSIIGARRSARFTRRRTAARRHTAITRSPARRGQSTISRSIARCPCPDARPHHRDDAGRPLRQERHHAARRSRASVAAVIQATGIPPAELMKLRHPHFDREQAIVRMPWRDKGAGTPPTSASCRRKGSRPSSRSMLRMHGGGSASRPLVTRSSGPRAGSAAPTRRSASMTSGTASGRIRTP